MSALQLACTEPGCRYRTDLSGAVAMRKHTMTDHHRPATRDDLTPTDPYPFPAARAWSDVDMIEFATTRVVDPAGRVWARLGRNYGFTRLDGVWVYAPFRPVVRPMVRITAPAALAALDRWEIATTPCDSDPTPAHGIPRLLDLVAL